MEGEFLAPTTKVDYPSTLDKHNTKGKPAIDNYMKLYKPKNEIVEGPKFKLIHFTSYNRAMPGTAKSCSQDQSKYLLYPYVFQLPYKSYHLGQ